MASRTGHGAQLRHPRDKALHSAALFTSVCPRPSGQMSAGVLSLTLRIHDVFQRWSQGYDRDACSTFLLEHLCSIHPEGCSLLWVTLTPALRGIYFPGCYQVNSQGRTNCRAPSSFTSFLLNIRIIIHLEDIFLSLRLGHASVARKYPARDRQQNIPSALFGSGSYCQLTEQP